MITARRSDGIVASDNARGGVDLLERASASFAETTSDRTESMEETKARMQRNLDRLLNYDRYAAMEAEETAATEEKAEAEQAIKAYSDDDIRPTTTTTQFIDGDPQVFNDAEKSKDVQKSTYRLNGKGKLVVVMYALVVTVILALIVLNTGVLRSLSKEVSALEESYNAQLSALSQQSEKIAEMSSAEHVIPMAEDLGMVLR